MIALITNLIAAFMRYLSIVVELVFVLLLALCVGAFVCAVGQMMGR